MTREIVIDASASAPWVLEDERTDHTERMLHLVLDRLLRILVPDLWHYESLNALRGAAARGRIGEREARKAQRVLESLPKEVVPAEEQGGAAILARAFDLNLTVYDATYHALADSRSIELVTSDRHLLALRPRVPWIMTIEEFLQNVWDRQPPEERPPSSVPEPPDGEGHADPGSHPGSG